MLAASGPALEISNKTNDLGFLVRYLHEVPFGGQQLDGFGAETAGGLNESRQRFPVEPGHEHLFIGGYSHLNDEFLLNNFASIVSLAEWRQRSPLGIRYRDR